MRKSSTEMPLFTKTQDFIVWLLPLSRHFPRLYRSTVTQRLLDAALDFQEMILEANAARSNDRLALLNRADGSLSKVRLYIRLAHRLHWINMGQYKHASTLMAEMGKLLGGWKKVTRI